MPLGQGRARHPGHQVAHVAGELRRALVGERVQRERRAPVGARRAPEPQVDAAGRDGVEHAELLRHLEGRVVRQHDAGAADADALGDGGDGRHQDLGRGADDGVVAVMLGDPEAVVAQRLAVLGERDRVADRHARAGVRRRRSTGRALRGARPAPFYCLSSRNFATGEISRTQGRVTRLLSPLGPGSRADALGRDDRLEP